MFEQNQIKKKQKGSLLWKKKGEKCLTLRKS